MSDIHGLVGAYAIDAVDDIERERFEQHLEDCADCRDEVATLREAGAMLSSLTTTQPPSSVRDRLMADISTVRPLPPPVTSLSQHSEKRRRRWFPAAVAAAAAVAVLGGGAVVLQPWQDQGTQQQVTATARVLQAPDAEEVSAKLDGDAAAKVVRSPKLGQAVLVTKDMPSAPDGKVYQLWLQNTEGRMVPAGLMPDEANQKVLLDGDAASATAAGITVEPDGGSKEPTTNPIALFPFKQSA
ncbi:MAG: anti-sigma factor [Nocardioides sp.]|nr:anti-sigma factor [Nocardioides sp.]